MKRSGVIFLLILVGVGMFEAGYLLGEYVGYNKNNFERVIDIEVCSMSDIQRDCVDVGVYRADQAWNTIKLYGVQLDWALEKVRNLNQRSKE